MSKFLKIADVKAPADMPADPPINYKFPLDPFQQHAMKAICNEENVLVTAKTGSGKTLVGEIQIAYSLRKGKRVFYTTPIKSLSNQKFHDLKKQFSNSTVGIMTGDIKFCPDASIVIMTTEILLNLLFKKDSTTKALGLTAGISCEDLDAVIFDECHYINDKDRGHVWEEVMILLPPEVKMVMLSATLDHPEYFAEWLGELKQRPINVISTEYRIVPLTHTLWYDNKSHILMDSKNIYNDKVYKDWIDWRFNQDLAHTKFQEKVKTARAGGTEGAISGKVRPVSFLHQMNELITTLQSKELLPALFFVLSRKDCEKYAQKVEGSLITSSETSDVRHIWNFHLRHHRESLEKLPQYHHLYDLVLRGIAFHHSGIVPMLKEIIELLFGKGLLKILFATETFAVGINMPTKTAVFVGLKKYDDEKSGMRMLTTAEYLQMAGRAGRRGLDTMGTVIYLPDRDPVEPSEMKAMMCGGKAPVTSRMEFDYKFILKTIQSGNRDWLDLLEKSYWRRQRETVVSAIKADQVQLLNRLKTIIVMDEEANALTEKFTLEREIKEFTNAKRKKAELALNRWKDEHNGARWSLAEKKILEINEVKAKLVILAEDLKVALDVSSTVEARIRTLESLGFLKPMDKPDSYAHTKESLTTKGVLATELNEADSLLVSQFYMTDESRSLEPQEVLALLAACISEGKKEEPSIDELNIPLPVKDGLYELNEIWNDLRSAEKASKAKPSEWNLCLSWVGPMWRWMEGDSVAQICSDYGIYEGNLIRSVLKLQNMLDEWRAMATYCNHTDVLKAFEKAHELLLREAVIQDSLYLHL